MIIYSITCYEDYISEVVKTFKAGQLAFFLFKNLILALRKQNNDDRRIYTEAAQYF